MVERGGPRGAVGARGGLGAIAFGGLGTIRGGGDARVSGLSLVNVGGLRGGEGSGRASVVPEGRRTGPLGSLPLSPFSMEGSARIPQVSSPKALEDDWNGGTDTMSARDTEEEKRRLREKLAKVRALLESL